MISRKSKIIGQYPEYQYVQNYLICNNLITTNQSGFKPGDSTTNQLLYLTHIIHSSFDLNMSRESSSCIFRYAQSILIKYDMKVYYSNLNKTEYLVKF